MASNLKESIEEIVGTFIDQCTEENLRKGNDPLSGPLNDISNILFQYLGAIEHDTTKGQYGWRQRCEVREKTAPDIYQRYFLPFINDVLRNVYDNKATIELKFFDAGFKNWVFMTLAVMTEYYFRNEYPSGDFDSNYFRLEIDKSHQSPLYYTYSSIPW